MHFWNSIVVCDYQPLVIAKKRYRLNSVIVQSPTLSDRYSSKKVTSVKFITSLTKSWLVFQSLTLPCNFLYGNISSDSKILYENSHKHINLYTKPYN